MSNFFTVIVSIVLSTFIISGCSKNAETDTALASSSGAARALYVASGACYSGNGITTFTAATSSNLIYKVNLDSGAPGEIVADYNLSAAVPGSSPVGIHTRDNDSIFSVVENATAGARRIEVVKNSSALPTYYYTNATAFSTALKKGAYDPTQGAFLVNRTSAIERINSSPGRDLALGLSWITNPTAANCAATNVLVTAVTSLPNGKILYGHSSATAANRKLVLISSSGYKTTADCLNTAAVTVPSYITDLIYLPGNNQVLVSMADSTTGNNMNSIYVYDIDTTTNTITNGTSLLENNPGAGSKNASYLYGTSAMAFDSTTNTLYVAMANAIATTVINYNIEKYTYDPVGKTLTRVGVTPWSPSWYGSKCISSMLVK